MRDNVTWIITCEHASSLLPKKYSSLIPIKVLQSHRGFDRGASDCASVLAQELSGKLFCGKYSRLLIDLNRSLHNPSLFSQYTKALSDSEKEKLVLSLYKPFRENVAEYIDAAIRRKKFVIHLSCHSFTSEVDGVLRAMDLGILYDPLRKNEREMSRLIQEELRGNSAMSVRLNAPYRGKSDGHTRALRLRFSSERYIGIEIEINQRLFDKDLLPLWEHVWFPTLVKACHTLESSCL